LEPEYEKVAKTFEGEDGVVVAKLDADQHKSVAQEYGVSGYPTIKFFPKDNKAGEDYTAGRTPEEFVTFLNQRSNAERVLGGGFQESAGRIPQLDELVAAFVSADDQIVGQDKDVLVEFYAPWCGHCKRLTPDYEKAAVSLEGEDVVVIAKVDADEQKELGSRFGVTGYPTLKWFPRGTKAGEEYTAGRTTKDFVEFVNTKSGTERTVGGGFLDTAGRIADLDTLAARFLAHPNERDSLVKQAESFSAGSHINAEFAKFYGIAMKRIIAKGTGFVAEESARLARLLAGGGITAKSAAQFHKRINIVKQFSS